MDDSAVLEHYLAPLRPLLAQDDVTELVINRPGEVGIEQGGRWRWHEEPLLTEAWLRTLAVAAAAFTKQDVSDARPICSTTLPGDERCQIVLPPAAPTGTVSLTIRKPSRRQFGLDAFATGGLFDAVVAADDASADPVDAELLALKRSGDWSAFFKLAVVSRRNILVSGATGSGKTTFAKGLVEAIPDHERLLTIEDTRELVVPHRNVVSQAWEMLPDATRTTGNFLDPACGSGVFLVRSFQRLCEHWRAKHKTQTISWKTLLSLLSQIHGWDLNGGAVRVAVFSLYVALLEEVSPRDIRKLITRGKLLPELWGKTLVCRDFFEVSPDGARYDVIIGNPPWTSRRGPARSSVQWSKKTGHPMPGGEDAWAFSWKALSHLADGGLIAFLLPAMGFLHNHASNTIEARDTFFRKSQVRRVINFADLRFQLFEKAHRPTALIIYGSANPDNFPYRFDYWAPKADLNLRIKRVITLSSADKAALGVGAVLDNPLIFKQRLWMREPDAKLFAYLARLPKLGAFISEYGSLSRRREKPGDRWVIGQGYQPFNEASESDAPPLASEYVGRLPDLPIAAYSRLAQAAEGLLPAPSSTVRRRGFESGFDGPRILVPRGVETSQNRLRAAYCDQPLTFQDILQAIVVPVGQSDRAKVLTAILNSRIAVWYAFHGTASFGSDRPEVKQADLLRLPFPSPDDVPDQAAAAHAALELIAIVDDAHERSKEPFSMQIDEGDILRTIDRLAYQYFCLSPDEIALIDDTVEAILPALQPHEGHFPKLWGAPDERQRAQYAHTLAASLADWFKGKKIDARLVARGADLAILRLHLGGHEDYAEDAGGELSDVLEQLAAHIHRPLNGNFQLMPDLRVFVGDCLYLIKPMQMRFWLRSTALADADGIALDLQQAAALPQQRGAD